MSEPVPPHPGPGADATTPAPPDRTTITAPPDMPAARVAPGHDGPGSQVWVVSGPTAVGKGTVVARLRREHPELFVSVSVTTRDPRPGEIDGVHYWFITESEFDQLVADNGLLEWATVHQVARYGTPRRPVEDAVTAGRPVVLEIDLQGARQVRHTMPSARSVFLAPPSWDELVHRLVGRGTENEEQRARRLATARQELAAADEFDDVVVNARIEQTVAELVELLGL